MPGRALPALFVCLLSFGCTVSSSGDAEEPKPNATDDAKPADEPAPDPEPAEEPGKPDRAAVAADALPDCPPEPEPLVPYCTDAGKLAGQWVPVDTLKVPDDVEIIFNAEGPDATRQTSLLIATRGDELYIRHVTCGACRRVLGQGFAGHLSHLSEAQIRELQTRLGLASELPVLTSAEQWKSFCGDERGQGALTQIAAKAEGDARGR